MAIKRIGNRAPAVLSIEQKIAAALLLFLFTGGIFFGFRSFGANLYRPIQQQFAKNVTGKVVGGAQDQKDMEALKKKDTDTDGLSDYDELYVYKTSPYLKDSDSDGVEDKTEVFGGTDPNCPVGKVCDGGGIAAGAEQTGEPQNVVDGLLGNASSDPTLMDSGKVQFKDKADVEAYFKKATMTEVRNALVKTGQISQEQINKMSDDDLKVFYDNVVGQAAASGQFDSIIESGAVQGQNQPTQTTNASVTTTNP